MHLRKQPGRWAALTVLVVAAGLLSGCNRVSPADATDAYARAHQALKDNKPEEALKFYQKASGAEVQPAGGAKIAHEQVFTEYAVFALDEAKTRVKEADDKASQSRAKPDYAKADLFANAAAQAFTTMVQQFADKKVDPAAARATVEAAERGRGQTAPTDTAEAATGLLNAGKSAEARGDKQAALDAYMRAAKVDFPQQSTARESAVRLALDLNKPDLAKQILKTSQPPSVNPSAEPKPAYTPAVLVKDWIGTPSDHKGDFYAAEALQDHINKPKPAYIAMDRLVALTGRNPWWSAAIALLIFTVVIKVLMTPLTKIQFHSTRKMTAIQPKMKALQEQYKDRPEEINRRVMALYKDEGVNPVGCGATMLIQFPILIALYSVIRLYNFQFREAYFLWINPATAKLAPGIIGASLAQPDMILLGLYAVSMFLSQKLTIMPAQDDQQRQQQMMMAYMMPIMFLFVLRTFPSAFVLYWLLFNIFTTWQQWHLLKMHPMPPPGDTAVLPGPSPRQPETGPKPGPKQTPAKRKKK